MGKNIRLKNVTRAGLLLATALCVMGDAKAQSYYPAVNSVFVDQSVLEDLGPAPSLASLLMPESQSLGYVPPRVAVQPLIPSGAATRPVVPKKSAAPKRQKAQGEPALQAEPKPKKTVAVKPAKPAKAPKIEPVAASIAPIKPAEMPKIVPAAAVAPVKVEPPAPKVVAAPPPQVVDAQTPKRIAPVKEEVPAAPEVKVAAVQVPPPPPPPAKAAGADQGAVSIAFSPDGQKIPDSSIVELRHIVDALKQDPSLKARITAGASGADPSKSRKLSLTRAHEVRKLLADMGIQSTRVDLSALGNTIPSSSEGLDRVDLQIIRR